MQLSSNGAYHLSGCGLAGASPSNTPLIGGPFPCARSCICVHRRPSAVPTLFVSFSVPFSFIWVVALVVCCSPGKVVVHLRTSASICGSDVVRFVLRGLFVHPGCRPGRLLFPGQGRCSSAYICVHLRFRRCSFRSPWPFRSSGLSPWSFILLRSRSFSAFSAPLRWEGTERTFRCKVARRCGRVSYGALRISGVSEVWVSGSGGMVIK